MATKPSLSGFAAERYKTEKKLRPMLAQAFKVQVFFPPDTPILKNVRI